MNIVITEPLGISGELLDGLCAPFGAHAFTAYDTKPDSVQALVRRAREADIVIMANTPFPAEAVDGCPSLRYIDVAFTGVDHVALDRCRQRGITVSNASGYSEQAVAELVIGQTVALLRGLPACDAAAREGRTGAGLAGREIAGRTVGIIGLGKIGLKTARLFQAFGARVIAHSPHLKEEARALGIAYVSLEELLHRSDIVTLHAPSNASTRGMLGPKQFALMKLGALFINCARGALVDSQALADALNQGRLAGAAADVFPMEPPLPPQEPLLHAKNMLLTPHIAFATEESMLRRARIVFNNLAAYLDGHPVNLV